MPLMKSRGQKPGFSHATGCEFSGFDQLQPLMNQVVERTESALRGRGRSNTLVDIGLSEHWVARREEEDGPVSLFNDCRNQTLVLNGVQQA